MTNLAVIETLVELENQKNNDVIDEILNDINRHLKKKYTIRWVLSYTKKSYHFAVYEHYYNAESRSAGFTTEYIDNLRKNPSEDNIKKFTKELYSELLLSNYLNF